MAIKRLIKNIVFTNDIRKDLTFSDSTKIRLNTEDQLNPVIQLKAQGIFTDYSTDADLYIETPYIEPNALKKWLKFEAIVVEDPNTFSVPTGASIGFKVKTTAGNYYWNGADWVVAGLSDWSTEEEINENIETFPIATVGDKKIGFIVNLKTTDPEITPEVRGLKVLGEFDIEELDDIIYNSVIRKLNTSFRSSSILRQRTSGSTSSINLNPVFADKGYNITEVRSVYNLSDDPLKLNNLFDSYTPGPVKRDGFTYEPGTITLTSAIPDNKIYEIVFEYVPEIFIRANQDYYEVPAYPSIVLESIIDIEKSIIMHDTNAYGKDYIRDKPNLTAVQQLPPRQSTIRFEYAVFTDLQYDQQILHNDVNKFFANNKFITSYGLDYRCGIDIVDKLNTTRNQRSIDDTDTNVSTGTFDVLGVLFYDKDSIDVPLVGEGQVNVTYRRL